MPTVRPDALLDLAKRLQQAAQAAKKRGETESAIAMLEAVIALQEWGDPVASREADKHSLTVQRRGTKIHGVEHTAAARERISKTLTGKSPNMDAARAAGVPSLRQLASHLGCTVSFLSQIIKGDRPMPPAKAEAFKKLTGKDWQP